jgi:DNA repair photolyase
MLPAATAMHATTTKFMELPPEDFERRIFIKENAAWLLEQELRQVRAHEEIALGTATNPYQPVERRAKITQSLLEVLARPRGLRIGVVTKPTLIERDIPLLRRIAERNTLVLHLTITTPNAALARLLEPRAPPA